MKKLLACIALYFLVLKSFGTCIFIYRTQKEIVAGADSRRLIYEVVDSKGTVIEHTSNNYCKIRKAGKFSIAVAGFDDETIHKYAMEACFGKTDPVAVCQAFTSRITPHFESLIESMRQTNPAKYRERFATPSVADVAFMYYEKGVPHVICLRFNLQNSPIQRVKIVQEPEVDRPITLLGVFDHIQKVDYKLITSMLDKNPVDTIKTFINKEAGNHPKWVGGAIDVLRLTGTEFRWVSKKPGC